MATITTPPATSLPTLSSGPFAGLPDLNAIYGAPQGNTVPLLNSNEPNLPSLPVQNPGLLSLPNLSPLPSLTPSSPSSSVLSGITSGLGAAASIGKGTLSLTGSTLFGISIGRAATFFLGLILIAGGIFLFRSVQTTITTAAKGASVIG